MLLSSPCQVAEHATFVEIWPLWCVPNAVSRMRTCLTTRAVMWAFIVTTFISTTVYVAMVLSTSTLIVVSMHHRKECGQSAMMTQMAVLDSLISLPRRWRPWNFLLSSALRQATMFRLSSVVLGLMQTGVSLTAWLTGLVSNI